MCVCVWRERISKLVHSVTQQLVTAQTEACFANRNRPARVRTNMTYTHARTKYKVIVNAGQCMYSWSFHLVRHFEHHLPTPTTDESCSAAPTPTPCHPELYCRDSHWTSRGWVPSAPVPVFTGRLMGGMGGRGEVNSALHWREQRLPVEERQLLTADCRPLSLE